MRKLKILIVDDNSHFQKALRFILEDRFETRVEKIESAKNGKEFLEKMKEGLYDLVFMNITMPDLEELEKIRTAVNSYRDVTIIAVSFHSDFKYIIQMLEAGARNYLIKDDISVEAIDKVLAKII
ncbi:MAG: response regulator transcription factor [Bacteroidales bacterium]|nr:response regulator transcription factor [Bacteroidales bacterium]